MAEAEASEALVDRSNATTARKKATCLESVLRAAVVAAADAAVDMVVAEEEASGALAGQSSATTAKKRVICRGSVPRAVAGDGEAADTEEGAAVVAEDTAAVEAAMSNVTNARDMAICPASVPIDDSLLKGLRQLFDYIHTFQS